MATSECKFSNLVYKTQHNGPQVVTKQGGIMNYKKKLKNKREKLTHRILHYLQNCTSPRYPEWRNETIRFFYSFFEIMETNHSFNILVHKDDGISLYSGSKPIVYLHFRQRHFLVHCQSDYILAEVGKNIFNFKHDGSWPLNVESQDRKRSYGFHRGFEFYQTHISF